MGFSINTNLDALNTYSNLTKVQNSLSSSLAKLSSGLRINNAGDDAAGLTIATDLGAQVSGLQQASRNAQDGTSVVQTADGALSQVQSLLGNLRDLAVQAANDSNSSSARAAITTQANAITAEIGRLGKSVNFNGLNLLDGSVTNMAFQVGANGDAQSQIKVNLSGANLSNIASSLSQGGAATSYALGDLNGKDVQFTSTDSSGNTTTSVVDLSAGKVTGTGTPTAAAPNTPVITESDVVNTLNANSVFSSRFNASVYTPTTGSAQIVITAKDGGAVTTGTYTAAVPANGNNAATPASSTSFSSSIAAASQPTNFGKIQFDSADHAQASIAAIQAQLDNVSAARAQIGAAENRFTSAESTISTAITNLTAAKSRITDVDMASEMVNYSRANILSQSGTAMLAQANSLPQLALKLLG